MLALPLNLPVKTYSAFLRDPAEVSRRSTIWFAHEQRYDSPDVCRLFVGNSAVRCCREADMGRGDDLADFDAPHATLGVGDG